MLNSVFTVICFVLFSAYVTVASTSVPFRPTTVQMSNLALIETRRITVYVSKISYVEAGALRVESGFLYMK